MQQRQSAQSIPPAIHRLAETSQLGTLQGIYVSKNISTIAYIMGPFVVLIGCSILISFFLTYNSVFLGWPVWQLLFVPGIGIAWLGMGVWITFAPVKPYSLRVVEYARGLVVVKSRPQVIYWEQIEALWKAIKPGSKKGVVLSYTIRQKDGTSCVFTSDLLKIEMLGEILEGMVSKLYLPVAFSSYRAGAPVSFGDLVLDYRGIAVQSSRKQLLWSEIRSINVDETAVSIYKTGEYWDWFTAPSSNIPNVAIFKALVDFIVQQRPENRMPRIIATYNAGVPIDFGELDISLSGVSIHNGETFLPWSEIASMGVGESEVIIRRTGTTWDWRALPVSAISDVEVLKGLLDYIMRRRASDAS
jgi:hypothetical protein